MSFIYFEVKIACRYKYLPTQLWHWLIHMKTLHQEFIRSSEQPWEGWRSCLVMDRSPGLSWELGGKIQKDDHGVESFLNCCRHGPSDIFCLFISLFRTQSQFSCPSFWLQVDRELPQCYPVGEKQFPKVKQNKIKQGLLGKGELMLDGSQTASV